MENNTPEKHLHRSGKEAAEREDNEVFAPSRSWAQLREGEGPCRASGHLYDTLYPKSQYRCGGCGVVHGTCAVNGAVSWQCMACWANGVEPAPSQEHAGRLCSRCGDLQTVEEYELLKAPTVLSAPVAVGVPVAAAQVYSVTDSQRGGAVVKRYGTRKAALRAAEKLNARYGSERYSGWGN